MAAVVGRFAANKLLRGHLEKYKGMSVCGTDDPFFATIKGRDGKDHKVNRKIPDYIPAHDADVLTKAKGRAYFFDMGFSLLGVRCGLTSVIGILPELAPILVYVISEQDELMSRDRLGDLIDICMALHIFYLCNKITGGLTWLLIFRMMLNIFGDFLVGLVPVLGDILDTFFRCNTRNVALLDAHLNKKYGPASKEAQKLAGLELPADYSVPGTQNRAPYQQRVIEPKRSQPVNTHGVKNYGWYGGGGKNIRVPDVENGQTGW